MTATPEDVLAGRARWCVVHAPWEDVLPGLPDGAVGHTITDPPYSAWVHAQEKTAGTRRDGSKRLSAIDFDHIDSTDRRAFSATAARLTRRWVLVFSDAESNAEWRMALEEAGLRHIRVGAWVKPDCSPQFSGDRPAAGFEAIEIATGPERPRWNGGGNRGIWTHGIEREERAHTTPKPVLLMRDLISDFTDLDEVVLDPFAGSGTTGVACLRLGRRVILIEKSEKYAALARERMEAEEKGLTLRDARAGQLPLLPMS